MKDEMQQTEQHGGIRSSAIPATPDDGTIQGRRRRRPFITQFRGQIKLQRQVPEPHYSLFTHYSIFTSQSALALPGSNCRRFSVYSRKNVTANQHVRDNLLWANHKSATRHQNDAIIAYRSSAPVNEWFLCDNKVYGRLTCFTSILILPPAWLRRALKLPAFAPTDY